MHFRFVATMFFTCVDQANLAVVEQFGKFNRIAQPGACGQPQLLCMPCSLPSCTPTTRPLTHC
jgi:hypothetical protein